MQPEDPPAALQAPSHLFKEHHGELLVRDAVSGCADIFRGLVGNVEVNPHQDVLLQNHREDGITTSSVLTVEVQS